MTTMTVKTLFHTQCLKPKTGPPASVLMWFYTPANWKHGWYSPIIVHSLCVSWRYPTCRDLSVCRFCRHAVQHHGELHRVNNITLIAGFKIKWIKKNEWSQREVCPVVLTGCLAEILPVTALVWFHVEETEFWCGGKGVRENQHLEAQIDN